ncbi:hypothetical protein STAS_11271 [Striga asiatica]|uniref:Uncharacterized protein n=1 Tax=Striga asiatica TaxID=4170 RepID=A0A5A7PQS1_STRAF|nr:hypothetical protein STAS_11271 [Striga asiatica]
MAPETWLVKVKKTIAQSLDSVRAGPPISKKLLKKRSNVGVLAFEVAGLMSKLLHLWQSLSDQSITRLRAESVRLEGVRKIVSNDDAFLLGLTRAELVENLKSIAKSISRISQRCEDPSLRSFDRLLREFSDSGHDPYNWVLNPKEMESKIKKMDQYVTTTANLHREMDELTALETSLKKSLAQSNIKDYYINDASAKQQRLIELQHKILWQRQEIKYLKEKSLWSKSFDTATSLLARPVFTILARIKLVFGVGPGSQLSLPRSLSSSSALVYPSSEKLISFLSGPLVKVPHGFFELNSDILKPPPTTLGAAALALHYSNLIIVMEKMIRSPQLVGVDARDDLYAMLPNSIRFALRARLKGVGLSACDPGLAAEWRDALHNILGWISPLAHNMIKWQSERSFEQHNLVTRVNNSVLLFQTLYFANQEKTEAAITELLVGLNYIWRFEREMNARAMFQCINFNGCLNSQCSS